jgi:thiol-disulfide isomerase/thioredoxin
MDDLWNRIRGRCTMRNVVAVAIVLGGWLVCTSLTRGADRTAAGLLKEIDAINIPALDPDKKDDKAYVKKHTIKSREAVERRARLIGELYKVAPDHERIGALMEERWKTLGAQKARYAELIQELEKVVSHTKNQKFKIYAAYTRAQLKLHPVSSKGIPDPAAAEAFLRLAPKDPRAGDLLATAVSLTRDEKKKAALVERLSAEYPESDTTAMNGPHNRSESIGKPFHLHFTNAIDGSTVSMKQLRGKVVVIDFWATWCGPCVGEMPKMKKLYAEYRDKGVEFIGVSLDAPEKEGGLDKLKKFVKENDIGWPQYYQGKGWDGEFSKSWGVNSIPCVFVVDAEGLLHSTDARGKLEKMIPDLLAKKAKVASAR